MIPKNDHSKKEVLQGGSARSLKKDKGAYNKRSGTHRRKTNIRENKGHHDKGKKGENESGEKWKEKRNSDGRINWFNQRSGARSKETVAVTESRRGE